MGSVTWSVDIEPNPDPMNPGTWNSPLLADSTLVMQEHTANHKGPDYDALHANFGWASTEIIKATFLKTTQICQQVIQPNSTHQHFYSQFLAANIHNRNELVATQVATTRA